MNKNIHYEKFHTKYHKKISVVHTYSYSTASKKPKKFCSLFDIFFSKPLYDHTDTHPMEIKENGH